MDSRLTNEPAHINPRMEPNFKKGVSFRSFFSSVSGNQIEMIHFLYRLISGRGSCTVFMLGKRCDFFTHILRYKKGQARTK